MHTLYKIYTYVIVCPLVIVWSIFIGLLVITTSLLGFKVLPNSLVPRMWGKVCLRLLFLDIEVIGREKLDKDKSYIFLANHQGYFDILLMYGYLGHSFKWMMKEYLKKMPIIGISCIISRQIFVGDSLSSIQKAVAHARETLKDGMSMSIFPEGTRTHDGKMIPFKRGAFMLANEIGLPLVPITINGSYKAFNRHAKYVTRTKLSLIIHDPITGEARQGKPTKQLMQEVHDIIEKDVVI